VLVHIAFCPNPPLLVPAVAGAAAADVEPLRTACLASVGELVGSGVERVAVLGSADRTATWTDRAGGSLRSYGPNVSFGGADLLLPLALTIGAYLLDQVGPQPPRLYQAVDRSAVTAQAYREGERLVRRLNVLDGGSSESSGLLVMGDGSAKRTTRAPGYLDARAEEFDATVALALSAADPHALLAVDRELSADLWCDGRVAWQAAAGAVLSNGDDAATGWRGRLRYDEAPYGVGYLVASWTR
jgi:hypothetical protein